MTALRDCAPVIVTTPELANIFGVTERTIEKLARLKLVVKVAPGRYDLIQSITAYMPHLRKGAASQNTVAAKSAALHALTALRTSQREKIERERGDYLQKSEVDEVFQQNVARLKQKMLDFPVRCSRAIQDHVIPMDLKTAVRFEEALDRCVDQLLTELITISAEDEALLR